ncbi:MAG TPA: YciI family protein [Kofleriaceae bacterium]|nr:YciI family protein [Kofleriaceae bacterium]
MMLMFPASHYDAGTAVPDPKMFEEMNRYNEELQKAGVLLALDGLHPQKAGARVRVVDGKKQIVDGPFTEAKEIVGGYWIIQTRTREEALEWARRVPLDPGSFVELRQIFEMSEFPEEIQQIAKPLVEERSKPKQ